MANARFVNKVVLITGAASGMGRATMVRLVSEGAIAIGVDVNELGLQETVSLAGKVAADGGSASYVVASVADEAAVKKTVSDLVAREGRLDVMVNMAGAIAMAHTTDVTVDDFMRYININLLGTFLFCRESIPHLLQSGGNIVNTASTAAFFGHPYAAAYAASKGGVAALTVALAWEYLKRGIRVNAIAPGGIETPMTAAVAKSFPKGVDLTLYMHAARPDQKMGQPADVAGVVAMLASDDGKFMNGEIVRIDGGVHA